jgi:transcriptional regulator with XRE-family HTH domain
MVRLPPHHPHRQVIGLRARRARKAKGLTQAEVGEALGYSQGAMSKIELGHIQVDALAAGKIAEVLGLDLADLLAPPTEEETAALESRKFWLR